MKRITRLLAILAFTGWASSASASLVQELFFYFPVLPDNSLSGITFPDSFEEPPMPASILPSALLTFPSRDGGCEEVECDAIGVEFSPFFEGAHSASWASFDVLYGSWFSLDNPLSEFLFDDMFIVFEGDVAQALVVEALIQAPP